MSDAPKIVLVAGPPGAGKSSLVARVASRWRAAEEKVGVVAVDPTSPYSGGALLGDRIRMIDAGSDPDLFVRSMATRGSLGGLATTTKEVLDLLDAFGFERVLVETVGVGQTELEVTAATDTVIVVLVPESGDAIQTMKAGLMEIADIFVVNKSDRPGATRFAKELRQTLHLRGGTTIGGDGDSGVTPKGPEGGWEIPVLETSVLEEAGIDGLVDAIERHRAWLSASGGLATRRRDRALGRVREVVERDLRRAAWTSEEVRIALDEGVDRIQSGDGTPYSVARGLLELLLR